MIQVCSGKGLGEAPTVAWDVSALQFAEDAGNNQLDSFRPGEADRIKLPKRFIRKAPDGTSTRYPIRKKSMA
jgi:hypothetical protein